VKKGGGNRESGIAIFVRHGGRVRDPDGTGAVALTRGGFVWLMGERTERKKEGGKHASAGGLNGRVVGWSGNFYGRFRRNEELNRGEERWVICWCLNAPEHPIKNREGGRGEK